MISSFLKALGAGLSLWEYKEKNKYLDELLALKQEYYEVLNAEKIDDNRLARIEFRLRILGDSFASKIKVSDTEN